MADTDDLRFEYGDPLHPRGNALAYWRLVTEIGEERITRLIVTNFVISPLFVDNQSIAATFPPQLLDSHDELLEIARRTNVDVLRVRDVSLPVEEFDFETFFKQQLSYFNQIVTSYTRLYTESLSGAAADMSGQPEASGAVEIDSLQRISELADQARRAFLVQQNAARAREMLLKIRSIANTLNSPTYKYDIENLLMLLNNPDHRIERLSQLYFRKFIAICTEHYEDAARLKRSIRQLSRSITPGELPERNPDA